MTILFSAILIIAFSALALAAGFVVGSVKGLRFMESKFKEWLRMSDYSEDEIPRILDEIKGIRL